MAGRVLVRDVIRRSLYAQGRGYFSAQDCVYSPPQPLRFKELSGRAEYVRQLGALYAARAEAWTTPVEVFRPWYSRAIGRYVLGELEARHAGEARAGEVGGRLPGLADSSLRIVEVGGGNGTNALHVLDLIKAMAPSAYSRLRYSLVEISPEMSARQRARVQPAHGDVTEFVQADFMEWAAAGVPDECETFVIALEVFDNLPHDKLVRRRKPAPALAAQAATAPAATAVPVHWWAYEDSAADEWFQTVVVDGAADSLAGAREELEPLRDPLALRAAQLFLRADVQDPLLEAERAAAPTRLSERAAAWARASLAASRARSEAAQAGVFVPSQLLRFVELLHARFPRHRLIAADFDSLPPPDISLWRRWRARGEAGRLEGCRNAPLVASKDARGLTIDQTTYLVPIGSADIFFATDFAALQGAYAHVTAGRSSTVMRSRDFLEKYAEHSFTRTRSGYNAMLEDYANTRFILS